MQVWVKLCCQYRVDVVEPCLANSTVVIVCHKLIVRRIWKGSLQGVHSSPQPHEAFYPL